MPETTQPAFPFVDPEGGNEFRILIVAEDPLARAGLGTLVEGFGWLRTVGQLAPGPDLEEDLRAYAPDAILWDLGWDPELGLEKLGAIDLGDLPLVVLLADEHLVADAWQAGARGLLPRDVSAEALAAAMATVLEGLAVADPAMLAPLVPSEGGGSAVQVEPLTPREMDVLRLMAEGLANKAIASRLDISEFTVKFHVNAILGKLGAHSRTEAAITAARMGLIPL